MAALGGHAPPPFFYHTMLLARRLDDKETQLKQAPGTTLSESEDVLAAIEQIKAF